MNLSAFALALALLCPQPRQATEVADTLLVLPIRLVAPAELTAQASLLRSELRGLFGPEATAPAGGTTVRLALDPAKLTRPEEYAVQPNGAEVVLQAHDPQGMFWAVHTLSVLLGAARRTPAGYSVTIPQIRDWPDRQFRAFMIQGAWTTSIDEFKRNLRLLARQHLTYVALEFGPQVVLDLDPGIARGGRFSKQQARELVEYMRSLGLKPIGYLNMLGHLERAYQKPPYTLHGGIDLRSDEAYEKFVYPVLTEMLEVYGPLEYFHCGMDEAWELCSWLSKEGNDVNALLARHIQRVSEFLKARGVKLVIWHDMLIAPQLREQLGGPVGPANGGPPQNSAAALASVPRDVVLDYWFYDALPAYPALDYLQKQGFTVWASPWQTPFSLVRYANARQAPVLGTLWSGPPGCFGSSTYNAVEALHAQAAWNESAAPQEVSPEAKLTPAAQHATSVALWGRSSLSFPTATALVLKPGGAERLPWPGEGEQYYGVPLRTDAPVEVQPLPRLSKSLAEGAPAAAVQLPGGGPLALDGVNADRGEDQMILYVAPRTSTGTNKYGVEVLVAADGTVTEIAGYGAGDHPVPAGGFVLSAHLGPSPRKGRRLEALHVGDHLAVLDAQGKWLGGDAPLTLSVELPDGRLLSLSRQDAARDVDELVLYHAGYGNGRTGTNDFGVEVAVAGGKVTAVRDGQGNSQIPADGLVLSAHAGATGANAAALRALKVGDAVALVVDRDGQRQNLAALLGERRRAFAIGARCPALYLAVGARSSTGNGTPLGDWRITYENGTSVTVPVRYGREALGPSADSLPARTDDPVWLIDGAGPRCLVYEWHNPHPETPVREAAFEPAPAVLQAGVTIIGATAAVAD